LGGRHGLGGRGSGMQLRPAKIYAALGEDLCTQVGGHKVRLNPLLVQKIIAEVAGDWTNLVGEERKFPSSPATAKITKVGIQLHFGWAHAHPGNRLSNLKTLARYLKFHF